MNKKRLLFVICLWITVSYCTNKKGKDSFVYITTTGNKYHTTTCRYLGASALPVSLEEACNRHYGPCSDCNPSFCKASSPVNDSIASTLEIDSSIENKKPIKKAVRCSGITKRGKQCQRQTKDADGRCFQHKE